MKRLFDFSVSAVAITLLSPVFLIFELLLQMKISSTIFFTQTLSGKHGKAFSMIKFRRMSKAYSAAAEHLTRFGRILRATSSDELPELWNALKGNLKLLGPHSLLIKYFQLSSPEQAL